MGDIVRGVDLGKGDYRVIGEKHITVFHSSAPKVMPLSEWHSLSEEQQKKVMILDCNFNQIKEKLNAFN